MNHDQPEKFPHEQVWRRNPAASGRTGPQTRLATDPQARAERALEMALTSMLDRLPPVPIPSNFTSRILQAVEREKADQTLKPAGLRPGWRSWFPRAAFAGLLLGTGGIVYHQIIIGKRLALARDVAAISQSGLWPAPEVLQDFDTIQQINPTPAADTELLALLP